MTHLFNSYYKKHFISYYRDTCTYLFIATLFIISRTWNQLRCPLTKKCNTHKGISSAVKKMKHEICKYMCGTGKIGNSGSERLISHISFHF